MSQAQLNNIQRTLLGFMTSPIPEKILNFTDEDTVMTTLQTFCTTMYMKTGHDIQGWTDTNQILTAVANQLRPYQKNLHEYGNRLVILQVFLTLMVQHHLPDPDAFIKGIARLGRNHMISIGRDSFNHATLLNAAGFETYSELPEMQYIQSRGIQIKHDGGYALLRPHASQLPHATKIGRYEWAAVTGNRMYHEGFSLAAHLRRRDLYATEFMGMPTPIFIAFMVDFHTRMYAEALQTPKRWTPDALQALLTDVKKSLPATGWRQYLRVVQAAVTALADEGTLPRKQAMALLRRLTAVKH
ncbi:hypothetical protein [Lacticaseibacillus rhamnosus]|uniref:hypothetical protein n=1 Tax=Lacticaseibacillus rhamnosus TaxID=47715 RepID=UPI001EF2DE2B|nr:hypothetical protein [Lacticaseibacillus rhamnosus]